MMASSNTTQNSVSLDDSDGTNVSVQDTIQTVNALLTTLGYGDSLLSKALLTFQPLKKSSTSCLSIWLMTLVMTTATKTKKKKTTKTPTTSKPTPSNFP